MIIELIRNAALILSLINPSSTSVLASPGSTHCMAIAAYGEARGDGPQGMAMVASTILNRHLVNQQSPCKIAAKGYSGYRKWKHKPIPPNDKQWLLANIMSIAVASGMPQGSYSGATSFINPKQMKRRPSWANSSNRLCLVGNHVVYQVKNL